MRLIPLKTADEMEQEYARRLQRCTLHNHIMLIGVVLLMAVYMWGAFGAPTGFDNDTTSGVGFDYGLNGEF